MFKLSSWNNPTWLGLELRIGLGLYLGFMVRFPPSVQRRGMSRHLSSLAHLSIGKIHFISVFYFDWGLCFVVLLLFILGWGFGGKGGGGCWESRLGTFTFHMSSF